MTVHGQLARLPLTFLKKEGVRVKKKITKSKIQKTRPEAIRRTKTARTAGRKVSHLTCVALFEAMSYEEKVFQR